MICMDTYVITRGICPNPLYGIMTVFTLYYELSAMHDP